MTTADFIHGIDFTGVTELNESELNDLVDLAYPAAGHGLVLVSRDKNLHDPDVPDAAITTKWKNYIWIRVPHASETVNTTPLIYAWNEEVTYNDTYLHWVVVTQDVGALTDRVDTLEDTVAGHTTSITSLTTTVGNASSGLVADVTTANTNASAALTATDGKLSTVDLNDEIVKLFDKNATTANKTSSRNAVTDCVQADKLNTVDSRLAALETAAGTSTAGNYVRILETTTAGANSASAFPTAAGKGSAQRRLTTLAPADTTLVSLSSYEVTVKVSGTYVIYFDGIVYYDMDANDTAGWQLSLRKNGTAIALGKSNYWLAPAVAQPRMNLNDSAMCVVALSANDKLTLYHNCYKKVAGSKLYGGYASGAGGEYEVYSSITLMKVG